MNGEVRSTDAKSETLSHILTSRLLVASLPDLSHLLQDVTVTVIVIKKENRYAAVLVLDSSRLVT